MTRLVCAYLCFKCPMYGLPNSLEGFIHMCNFFDHIGFLRAILQDPYLVHVF